MLTESDNEREVWATDSDLDDNQLRHMLQSVIEHLKLRVTFYNNENTKGADYFSVETVE